MGLVAPALVVREQLRVDEVVTEVAVEAGIEPVHHLIDLRPLLEVGPGTTEPLAWRSPEQQTGGGVSWSADNMLSFVLRLED
jgi:hypothetical protein